MTAKTGSDIISDMVHCDMVHCVTLPVAMYGMGAVAYRGPRAQELRSSNCQQ